MEKIKCGNSVYRDYRTINAIIREKIECWNVIHVIVKSIFVTVFTIKRPMVVSEARARGLLMVKTVNKYTLNSLVSDLFCDRQRM